MKLNGKGSAHASSLVGSGNVDTTSSWSFSADDGNKLLGANGDDWSNYGQWFLGVNPDAPENTKEHYHYPYGKNGKVFRAGLIAAKQRAAQQGESDIEGAADSLLQRIDKKDEKADVTEVKTLLADAAERMQTAATVMGGAVMHRAYSTVEVKKLNEELRELDGFASTPSPDRVGDIVEPKGAIFKLPMPLLWQHDPHKPIGHVLSVAVEEKGLRIKARIAKGVLPYIDDAWALIKAGLVRGLSIGFTSREEVAIRGVKGTAYDARRFLKWEWLELSTVTIPANAEATISTIKSLDAQHLAASGNKGVGHVVRLANDPGDSGLQTKGREMRTVAEQIASFEAKRAADVARMEAIMAKSAEEGRTLDETENEEYEGLQAEVNAVDAHLTKLKAHQKLVETKAAPVPATPAPDGQQQRNPVILQGKSNLPKGTAFTRYAMALAASRGSKFEAIEMAKQWRDSTPEVELRLKAPVAPGTTDDQGSPTTGWAAPLVVPDNMTQEFVELLRPATIVGKVQGLRRVPFNIRMPRTVSGSSAGWVGEGKPKPVSKMSFDTVTLAWNKIAGIVVLTEELVKFSNPAAEAIVRQDMIDTIAEFTDQQFIDPTVTATATSPASITQGITGVPSTGATVATIMTDVQSIFKKLIAGNITPKAGVWVMHPRTALYLSMLRTAQDVYAFPGINMYGGTFYGLPVVTSASVPIDTGDDTYIVLMDAAEVYLADEGGVALDVSREASLQMDSAPSDGAQSLVSLWQNNLVGLRAERFITWKRRRDAAIAVLEDVSY